jgi:hypothetical protein
MNGAAVTLPNVTGTGVLTASAREVASVTGATGAAVCIAVGFPSTNTVFPDVAREYVVPAISTWVPPGLKIWLDTIYPPPMNEAAVTLPKITGAGMLAVFAYEVAPLTTMFAPDFGREYVTLEISIAEAPGESVCPATT